MNQDFKPAITIFYCVNAIGKDVSSSWDNLKVKGIKLPCSSMVKDVFLLRAFEAGADGVIVLTCPEGECRYTDGNKRARKRVERVKALLDDIGLGGQRLSLFNIAGKDKTNVDNIINKTALELVDLGPNPAV